MISSHATESRGAVLRPREFEWIARFLYERTGIVLRDGKQPMVQGRLDRRLRHYGCDSYEAYFRMLSGASGAAEATVAIDLLTTNETYFFREPAHFEFLDRTILPTHPGARPFRAWSAASSSGEEAYSIAMTLADGLGGKSWEVVGTDISTRVLERARRGLYGMDAVARIPPDRLRRHMLRGRDEFEGQVLVDSDLRRRVAFRQANLLAPPSDLGLFDVIFLRNVLIYFDAETKDRVIRGVLSLLQPEGHLFVSHSESLSGFGLPLRAVRPSIYRRP